MRRAQLLIRILTFLSGAALLAACGSESASCAGPTLNYESLIQLKRGTKVVDASVPAKGFLVVPNPMEATKNNFATATSTAVKNALSGFLLDNLTSTARLENEFVKIRQREINETGTNFAKADANGNFKYDLADKRYWETMTYFSINSEIAYLEALGFKFVKNRPLYAMVDAKASDGSSEPNAFYNHNYLNPSSPRTIQFFGDGEFATAQDADIIRHEMGHAFNEAASGEVGFDYAGDNGAYETNGASLHEAMADYVSMTIGEKPTIGKWIARAIQGYAPGAPLRSAVDDGNRFLVYQDVAFTNAKGTSPERYAVAEWITRVLWGIRQKFITERGAQKGPINADLLMFSSLSLLKRDSSLTDFRNALVKADQKLYCGGHVEAIQSEFEKRGFTKDIAPITEPIEITAKPVSASGGAINPGAEVAFAVSLKNVDSTVARNVRVRLESVDKYLITTTYMQGYGDFAAGQAITVGSNNGWPLDAAVKGQIDSRAPRGSQVRFKLRVYVENGPTTTFDGSIQL